MLPRKRKHKNYAVGRMEPVIRKTRKEEGGKSLHRNPLDNCIFNTIRQNFRWVETSCKVVGEKKLKLFFLRLECFILRNTFTLTQLRKELSILVLHFPFYIKEKNMVMLKRGEKRGKERGKDI